MERQRPMMVEQARKGYRLVLLLMMSGPSTLGSLGLHISVSD